MDVTTAVLSIGRGNGKSALTAGIALTALMEMIDDQPRREIIVAARTWDQGRISFDFAISVAGNCCAAPNALYKLDQNPH